ncbi:MAG: rRNA cytosine-C5-methyltransferase [Bacteroidaceae bacterium]|nr:rRNA cytosine-C5-methyltransferase [Bacteroidaceae bacterium]
MELNAEFVRRTEQLFGNEIYSRFSQALDEEPVVSVRYNARKHLACGSLSKVPWASNGYYLEARPAFTADPLFHAGCYYVQEASSMFIEQVVKRYVSAPVKALDLCAAPGGKSTHLLSLLPEGSMLVSNEPMPMRAQVLAENVIKWGCPASMVTKNMPADFARFENCFDLVLVDAPCSGEGMFRKEPKAVEQWSVSNVEMCAERQREILADIWPSLRPGGLLIYSTCTFNREENEDNVRWISENLGAEYLEADMPEGVEITGSLAGDDIPAYRFIPGMTAGEGFFMAALRKNGDSPAAQPRQARWQKAAAKQAAEAGKWIETPERFEFVSDDDRLAALPKEHASMMMALKQKLNVLHYGLPVAEVKNGKMLPLHQLAMSFFLRKEAFRAVEVELEQALAYLHREALVFSSEPLGHLLLTYKGVPIGFVKNVGNRANNLYPAEWRIRKNPIDL